MWSTLAAVYHAPAALAGVAAMQGGDTSLTSEHVIDLLRAAVGSNFDNRAGVRAGEVSEALKMLGANGESEID